jgi:hypothetical protein
MLSKLRYCFLVGGSLLAGIPAFGQVSTSETVLRARIKMQADKMDSAFVKHDYPRFASFIYPGILKMAGGPEQVVKAMMETASAFNVRRITSGEPTAIVTTPTGELQSALLLTSQVQINGQLQTVASATIAVSADKGQNWTFLDTQGRPLQAVRQVFPTISSSLQLPR